MRFAQKLYYLFLLFFAVLFAGMGFYLHWVETQAIKKQLRQDFDALFAELAESSRRLIRNQNPGALYQVLNEQVKTRSAEGRLLYLRILDDKGVVFFSNKEAEQGQLSKSAGELARAKSVQDTTTAVTTTLNAGIGEVYDMSIALPLPQANYLLRAGFFLGAHARLNTSIFFILFLALGFLTMAFVLLLNWIIIKPVEELTVDANRIAHGLKRDFSAARQRGDEIGDLARSLHFLLKELEAKRLLLAEQEKLAVLGKGTGRLTHNMSNLLNPLDHYFAVVQNELACLTPSDRLADAINKIEKHVNLVRKDLTQLRNVIPDRPVREKYPLSVLVETALSRLLKPDNISIRKNFGDSKLTAAVDPEQITDVFYNLALNALQAMPDGGALTITLERRKNDVWVIFQDTGLGIAPEKQKEIFQFFYSTKKDGMGIGLSSSLEMVRNHGGTIVVESAEGAGAAFTVKLSLAKLLVGKKVI